MQKAIFATPEINLLPEDDLESKPGGKFLKWALSWGKKIVILTELMVVLAFLSRFKLDSDVANLSEEIDRRKAIITASSDFEAQYRSLTDRVKKVKKITDLTSPVLVYDATRRLVPQGIELKQITVKERDVSLEASGEDKTLATMVALFKSSSDFENVVIDKVSKGESSSEVDLFLKAKYSANLK